MDKQKLMENQQKTQKNKDNNTFNSETIIPIIRRVQINERCYAIYSTLHKLPLAVHQFLDLDVLQVKANRDGKDFFQEPNCDKLDRKFFIDQTYYDKTKAASTLGVDKGHMAPAKNYANSQKLMNSTYTFANCIPQDSYFNRGSWKNLESYCRNLLRGGLCKTLQVVSGPVFYSNLPQKNSKFIFENKQITMLQNGMPVPLKCYKIVKANLDNDCYMSAFLFNNQKRVDNEELLSSHIVDIEDLQYMTGLRFNFGKTKKLAELDPVGMNKTMGDLHLEFYTKLYKNATTISAMNSALKQGYSYKVKVNLECVDQQTKQKMLKVNIDNILEDVGWVRTSGRARRKINSLLVLHHEAYDLKVLKPESEQRIIDNIQSNIEAAKNEQQKLYMNYIKQKLNKSGLYGYNVPLYEELKAIFCSKDTEDTQETQKKTKKINYLIKKSKEAIEDVEDQATQLPQMEQDKYFVKQQQTYFDNEATNKYLKKSITE